MHEDKVELDTDNGFVLAGSVMGRLQPGDGLLWCDEPVSCQLQERTGNSSRDMRNSRKTYGSDRVFQANGRTPHVSPGFALQDVTGAIFFGNPLHIVQLERTHGL